ARHHGVERGPIAHRAEEGRVEDREGQRRRDQDRGARPTRSRVVRGAHAPISSSPSGPPSANRMVGHGGPMPTVTRDRYDALVLDLDGTLLDRRGKLSDPTRRAVRRARDAGYLVVIATGRSLSGAKAVHQDLGLDTALCAYNGAWIGPAGG